MLYTFYQLAEYPWCYSSSIKCLSPLYNNMSRGRCNSALAFLDAVLLVALGVLRFVPSLLMRLPSDHHSHKIIDIKPQVRHGHYIRGPL